MKIRITYIPFLLIISYAACCQKRRTEFADRLVEAHFEKWNDTFDRFYGGSSVGAPVHYYIDPTAMLGDNPYYVSLPKGSYAIVQFTDNVIFDHPEGPDLFIDEQGKAGDMAKVFISDDGITYQLLGIAEGGKTNYMDLADIDFKGLVTHLKILGLDINGDSPGFDVIRIYGLPNSNIDKYIPLDSIGPYLERPNTFEQRVVLKPIQFEFNSHVLQPEGSNYLDNLASTLAKFVELDIKIVGHTDNIGTDEFNQQLSEKRAKSVYDYLKSKDINVQITYEGRGEKEPIKSNKQESGRAKNRRVELIKIN